MCIAPIRNEGMLLIYIIPFSVIPFPNWNIVQILSKINYFNVMRFYAWIVGPIQNKMLPNIILCYINGIKLHYTSKVNNNLLKSLDY